MAWRRWQGVARAMVAVVMLVAALAGPRPAAAQQAVCFTSSFPGAEVGLGGAVTSVAVGDINGDGKLDIAAALTNAGAVAVRLGTGDGQFTVPAAPQLTGLPNPASVALGDFNGDGNLDLVTGNLGSFATGASIRLGDGHGGFTSPPVPELATPGFATLSIALGDIDHDGNLDMALVYLNFAVVSIRLGDGHGGFTSPATPEVSIASGGGIHGVALGDVNGDGNLDLVVAVSGSNRVSIRLGDGHGAFTSPAVGEIGVGFNPVSVALGDFNGDGKLDFVAANRDADTASVRLGDGHGGFTLPLFPQINVGDEPVTVAVGDFNADGRLDFATVSDTASSVSVRLGDGQGNFSGGTANEVTLGAFGVAFVIPQAIAVGDFNGDHALDFATADLGANTVSVRLNCLTDSPPAASVPGVQTVAEDGTLTFSSAAGNAISLVDPDPFGLPIRVSLAVSHGTLSLAGTNGLTFASGDGTTDPTMTFTGSLTQVNAALSTLIYAPAQNFNGVDQLSVTVSDQGVSGGGGPRFGTGLVAITVTPVNDAPTAADDRFTARSGLVLTVDAPGVLSNDADIDSPTLTAVKVTDPAHGTLTLNADGGFSYTPAAGFVGTDTFSYRASDGTSQSSPATATITVTAGAVQPTATNVAPTAVNDSFTVVAQTTLTVPAPGLLANDTDPDSPILTAANSSNPAHGTLTVNPNGSFSYVPNADFFGTDSFTYRASDGTSQSSLATVAIQVTPTQCGPRPRIQATPIPAAGKLQVHVESTAWDPLESTCRHASLSIL